MIDSDGDVGIGTQSPVANLHVKGSSTLGSLLISPSEVTSGDTAQLLLAEDSDYSYGMSLLYDGADNYLKIFGNNGGTTYGPHMSIERDGGIVHFHHNVIFNETLDGGTGPAISATTTGTLSGAVFGRYGSTGNFGLLGDDDYGIYADLKTTGTGDYAIYGYGVGFGVNGTSYSHDQTLGGVKGYNHYGNPYTFGVAGYSYLDENRSGGCFGGNHLGTSWGCLGYKDSGGTTYGAYWTNWGSGTGDRSNASVNIGMGSWGDLFGADIHGNIYGTFTEGKNYSLYSKGTVFKNGLDVHLQDNNEEEMAVFYTHVSTDVTVQTSGFGTLTAGRCFVEFDKNFKNIVSQDIPVIVTVTPMGRSDGIYLNEISSEGFSVEEDGDSRSNINFTYIAIGRRKGFENPQLPQEVIASDYTDKLARGLHNDNDTETDGEGLYYENGKLYVGRHASTFPDPNKPKDPEALNTGKIIMSEKTIPLPDPDIGPSTEVKATAPISSQIKTPVENGETN